MAKKRLKNSPIDPQTRDMDEEELRNYQVLRRSYGGKKWLPEEARELAPHARGSLPSIPPSQEDRAREEIRASASQKTMKQLRAEVEKMREEDGKDEKGSFETYRRTFRKK